MIRAKPRTPRIRPSTNPAASSRRIICHQSERVTSPSANARTMSVAACEPELPPDEMIRGKNNARMTAWSIVASKADIAVAVRKPPTKRTTSHVARFRISSASGTSMYESSSAWTAPNFCISSVACSSAISRTSSNVTMPRSLLSISTTGSANRSRRLKVLTAVS